MTEKKGIWYTKKADSGFVFVHLRKKQASSCKTMQETWGVRFDIEPNSKNSPQSL